MTTKEQVFGIQLDNLTMQETVEKLTSWIEKGEKNCPYVVTPNLDHIVQLQTNQSLQQAYAGAGLVLTDGKPVYFALRLLGRPVKQTVPGSDLTPAIFQHYNSSKQRLKIFLLGGGHGVAEKAAANIKTRWPYIEVAGTDCPPFGFENSVSENKRIIAKVNAVRPELLVVCLGAPKQELWIHQYHSELNTDAALCVGATIDFLAGSKKRAPVWIRKLALEWLFRMCSDPKRLVRRYVKDALLFPVIFWQEWCRKKM